MAPNAHFAWLNRLLRTVPWVRVGSAWTTLLLELLYPATTLLELALPRSIAASLLSLSFSSVAMGMHMMIMASTGINFKLLYIAHLGNLPELCFLLGRLRGALSESPDAELSPPLFAARAAKVAGAGGGDGGGVCSLGRALALSCGAAAAMSPLYFIVADVDWWPVSNYKVFCDHRKAGKTITAYRYAFGARGVEHQCGIGRLVGAQDTCATCLAAQVMDSITISCRLLGANGGFALVACERHADLPHHPQRGSCCLAGQPKAG